jgi:hypothetical protein
MVPNKRPIDDLQFSSPIALRDNSLGPKGCVHDVSHFALRDWVECWLDMCVEWLRVFGVYFITRESSLT